MTDSLGWPMVLSAHLLPAGIGTLAASATGVYVAATDDDDARPMEVEGAAGSGRDGARTPTVFGAQGRASRPGRRCVMKDLAAGLGVVVFLVGCYLLMRLAFAAPEHVTFIRFWGAFGIATIGCVTFCAADPFFER